MPSPTPLGAKRQKCLRCVFGMGVLLWGLTSCAHPRPESFPDVDIVYESSGFNNPSIGFVNADGSNNVVLPLDFYPSKPVWSADGKTLYFLELVGGGANISYYPGAPTYWTEGQALTTCQTVAGWTGTRTIAPTAQVPEVLLQISNAVIVKANLQSCAVVATYYDQNISLSSSAPALSADEQWLAYSVVEWADKQTYTYTVRVLNRTTGQISTIGPGVSPALAPNGTWVAYTRYDGLYISAIDGTQTQKLVDYNALDTFSADQFVAGSPTPRWSPDGRWLIYHKCLQPKPSACGFASEFGIFKIEVATGQEVKVIEGGMYPFWRAK